MNIDVDLENLNPEAILRDSTESVVGFYCLTQKDIEYLSKRFTGVVSNHAMTINGRLTNKCPSLGEHKCTIVQEYFEAEHEARLRAKAIDVYSYLTDYDNSKGLVTYKCKIDSCEAKLSVRKVDKHSDGHEFGLFG